MTTIPHPPEKATGTHAHFQGIMEIHFNQVAWLNSSWLRVRGGPFKISHDWDISFTLNGGGGGTEHNYVLLFFTHWSGKGTLQGFFKGSWCLCWCSSLYKSNIFQTIQPVTTIIWISKAANSVENRIKAGLVQAHHMQLFCMASLTACSVRTATNLLYYIKYFQLFCCSCAYFVGNKPCFHQYSFPIYSTGRVV